MYGRPLLLLEAFGLFMYVNLLRMERSFLERERSEKFRLWAIYAIRYDQWMLFSILLSAIITKAALLLDIVDGALFSFLRVIN